MTNDPRRDNTASEIATEAMLYGTIYVELTKLLYPQKVAQDRARAAVEDFRASRLLAIHKMAETKQ